MRSFQRLLAGAHKALHGVANLDPSLPTARGRPLPASMGQMSTYSHSTAVNDGQNSGDTSLSGVRTTFLNFYEFLGVATTVTRQCRAACHLRTITSALACLQLAEMSGEMFEADLSLCRRDSDPA